MKRPSILFVNRVYPPANGASGRLLQELARALAKEGWHVTILTTGKTNTTEKDGSITVIRTQANTKPRSALDYALVNLKLYAKLRSLQPKHILVTMTDPPMLVTLGARYATKHQCKHIHWCHDLYPDLLPALDYHIPGFMMNRLKAMSTKSLKSCDKIITIGRCMAKHLSEKNIDPTKITVIPNWSNLSLRETPKPPKSKKKGEPTQVENFSRPYDQLIKDSPKFRVLYAGTFGKAHPIKTIISAAQYLSEAEPDIEFVFVGNGAHYEKIAKERTRLGLNNIRLLPFQPEDKLKTMLESGDIHLISMNDEAAGALVPCKLYSALSVHRPCIFIGPEQSEAAKVINDFKAGTLIPQGDVEALSQAITKYLKDSQFWFDAHHGAEKAANIFLPEESINAWIERAWTVIQSELIPPKKAPAQTGETNQKAAAS